MALQGRGEVKLLELFLSVIGRVTASLETRKTESKTGCSFPSPEVFTPELRRHLDKTYCFPHLDVVICRNVCSYVIHVRGVCVSHF